MVVSYPPGYDAFSEGLCRRIRTDDGDMEAWEYEARQFRKKLDHFMQTGEVMTCA